MTEDHRENLSTGMDGELSSEALRFLLRRLDHDVSLQQAWSNYHAIGDGMRRELPMLASHGFSARVMLAIEQEQGAGQSLTDGKRRHWLRWSAGGAIAASVAVVALMTAQPAGERTDNHAPAVAVASARPVSRQSTAIAQTGTPPAAVPSWLSDNSDMPDLTVRATAKLGGAPSGEIVSPYANYQLPRYHTFNNNDGSYLLLIDTDAQQQAANQRVPQQVRATAH